MSRPRSATAWDAVRRGHKRVATATLHNLSGPVGDVPINDGNVTFSMSKGGGIREGKIFTPGYALWDALDPGTNCWIVITVTLDGEVFEFGEFPVLKVSEERPGSGITIDLGDWAYRRARAKSQNADDRLLAGPGVTVAQMVSAHLGHVIGGTVTCTQDDSYGALMPTEVIVGANADVYAEMERVANDVGVVIVNKSRTTFELRKFDPNAPYHDEITGTVVNATRFVDAESAVNRVVMTAESSDPNGSTFRAVRTLTTGKYAWDAAKFGHAPKIETTRVPTATQAIADGAADYIFQRQIGIVRGSNLVLIPQPWVEIGDILVERISDTRIDQIMVDSIDFPLTAGGLMSIGTRNVQVAAL